MPSLLKIVGAKVRPLPGAEDMPSAKKADFFKLLLIVCATALALVWPVASLPVRADEQTTIPSPETLQGCGGVLLPSGNEAFEQEVVRLVNQIRLDNGLLPLKRVDSLTAAARFHATDMSEEDYFSHTSYDRVNGELVEACKWSNRLATYYNDWQSISENIAAGYLTPASVVDGWLNSTGHRKNILSPDNWEMGVGYFLGSGSYGHYWVQDFGRRKNVYPVVINSDNETSDDGSLTIYVYGDWEETRLRVDQSDWSGWQPFALPMHWQLKAAAGQHSVEIEMRSANASATASDSIYLSHSTAEPELNTLPDSLTFTYDPATETIAPGLYTIQPLAAGGDAAYIWQVAVDASWLTITPAQGSGSEVVSLVPSLSGENDGNNEQALVTVSLRKSDGTLLAEKKISVALTVTTTTYAVFVPLVSGK
ncbi:MAG: hypothetical protein DWI57_02810 [Chloroflexi bacterium]|nr:MAG: hypothetical protein DWI57_02810 [Chloroflexota bacterium]